MVAAAAIQSVWAQPSATRERRRLELLLLALKYPPWVWLGFCRRHKCLLSTCAHITHISLLWDTLMTIFLLHSSFHHFSVDIWNTCNRHGALTVNPHSHHPLSASYCVLIRTHTHTLPTQNTDVLLFLKTVQSSVGKLCMTMQSSLNNHHICHIYVCVRERVCARVCVWWKTWRRERCQWETSCHLLYKTKAIGLSHSYRWLVCVCVCCVVKKWRLF